MKRLPEMMALCVIVTLSLALGGNVAEGAITYIDAAEGSAGNTYATGGSLGDTSWLSGDTGSGADEDQWKKRAFANSGTVFQSRHSTGDGDDMPELTTEITGLSDGDYTIWAYFWDAAGGTPANTWTLSAGLTSGALSSYSFDGPGSNSVIDANTQAFSASVLATDSDRTLYGINLGTASVSGGSDINVYLDNLIGGGSATRTWYDGVGYEAVPEPTSVVLLALGMAMAVGFRRRKIA